MIKKELITEEWIEFHIFIDKMGITNKDIYQTILNDFKLSGLSIKDFINSYHRR